MGITKPYLQSIFKRSLVKCLLPDLQLYKVLHLKPNGAYGVLPLLRPCWIPPNTGCLYAHAWASSVHSTVLYRPPTWTGNWLYSNAFSCVNVILNGNHQAVFAQSTFKHSLVKCLLPDLQFTRLWRNSKPMVLWQTKNKIINARNTGNVRRNMRKSWTYSNKIHPKISTTGGNFRVFCT